VVIGAHTPESSFEHNIDNVKQATRDMRVDYPVAIDNDYAVWVVLPDGGRDAVIATLRERMRALPHGLLAPAAAIATASAPPLTTTPAVRTRKRARTSSWAAQSGSGAMGSWSTPDSLPHKRRG
jgi:hypothetical protein